MITEIRSKPLLIMLAVLLGCGAFQVSGPAVSERLNEVHYNRDIRPILAEACFPCHGPDPASRKAKMRFDREESFFEKREHGQVVVKGQPLASLLYQRISTDDKSDVMPPLDAHVQLKPAQKMMLRAWIEQGAEWQKHWAFLVPDRPPVPKVSDETWVRNPIDGYVLAAIEANNLHPTPEADRRTLARRLSLDLTGLPPTPAMVDDFVADSGALAYERLVDRLIADPHYGEHRARYWLDAARYADTHGNHFDNYREMWPYRDWVINAFNTNQKFDQFTIEQIAGDLLPNPTKQQRIATGFHRCNMTTNEGGTIEAENLAGYARDRVETTSWVWLGLTANCAVCHDHKFDPISQRDFYAMSAYFRNTTQPGTDGNVKDSPPILRIAKMADEKRADDLPENIKAARLSIDQKTSEARAQFDTWLTTSTVETWGKSISKGESPDTYLPLNSSAAEKAFDGFAGSAVLAASVKGIVEMDESGPFGPAISLSGSVEISYPAEVGDFNGENSFSVSCWVKVAKDSQEGAIFGRIDNDNGSRGWNLWLQGDELASHLIHHWGDDALKVRTKDSQVKRDTWQHVCITYDGKKKAAGLKIYVDGKNNKAIVDADTLKGSTHTGVPFKLTSVAGANSDAALWTGNSSGGPAGYTKCAEENGSYRLSGPSDVAYGANGKFVYLRSQNGVIEFNNATFGDPLSGVGKAGYFKSENLTGIATSKVSVQQIKFYNHVITDEDIARQAVSVEIQKLLSIAPAQRDKQTTDQIFQLLNGASAGLVKEQQLLTVLESELKAIDERSIVTHIQVEKAEKAMAFILLRGEYDKRGEQVEPGVFHALHPQSVDAPKNRLGLAQWLIAPDNGLTPRVIVNRLWQEIFGDGIVKTSEDFGVMGEAPSNPALIDWLAAEFRSDWDYQRMVKLIVNSATYRQSATASLAQVELDPKNRLLSRGPRFRMDAEVIRDYALCVSGLLVETIGGPSVKPYQPDGVWEAVGMNESDTKRYVPDHGAALYRRSMYSFWKRMAPPASMEILNATNRETSCLRRERTNTPLQALVTLNDPQFIEAARVLAEQILRQPATAQIIEAGRRILLRNFSAAELALVKESHGRLLVHYGAHNADAKALIAIGEHKTETGLVDQELAAMTMICNALLNLDEVLNK